VTKKRLGKQDVLEELEVIEEYNRLDIELYRYARSLFEELIAQQGPSFERELQAFKFLTRVYGIAHMSSRFARRKVKALVGTFAQPRQNLWKTGD
jgi:hypothetical protein